MNALPINVSPQPRCSIRIGMMRWLTGLVVVASALVTTPMVLAATDDAAAGQTVECMLPGQIHTIAGHATMGPRRPVEVTPEDCRQQGGEYTVDAHASQPVSVPHAPLVADDGKILNCLLPQQVRQLGEKARYVTARRPIRTTRTDCAIKGGDVITSVQARKAARDYRAAQAKAGTQKKQP